MQATALITGGTGALGGAVVQAFLDRGWRVVVTWIVAEERDRLPQHERLVAIQKKQSLREQRNGGKRR